MKRTLIFILSFGLLATLATIGCSKTSAENPGQASVAQGTVETEKAVKSNDTVAVNKDGTKFDPKIEKSQVPDGAWYCDMGDVHYARMEKGDGKCELCGMMLTKKGAETAGEDGADHDHHGHHH